MPFRDAIRKEYEKLIADERAIILSILISQLKDIELAEDALQNAFIKAWNNWQKQGIPNNPKSWLLKTAYNDAIDQIRRKQNFNRKQLQISQLYDLMNELNQQMDDELLIDERLKLIFTCCHPALDQPSQVALVLSTICDFSTEQLALIFLLKTPTMAQRLVRAKRKIKRSGIPFKTPTVNELPTRLASVLSVIYFIYNHGYYAAVNPSLINNKQTNEAIYLALTLNQLLPEQAELMGLLALMYFHMARFEARVQNPGHVINLEHQNRMLWDLKLISQAQDWFKKAVSLKSLGPYQIQAAISGVHCQAKEFKHTDWHQIIQLYAKLYEYQPSPIIQINQAVALTYNKQAQLAIELLADIEQNTLDDYLPFYLAKAHALKCFCLLYTSDAADE